MIDVYGVDVEVIDARVVVLPGLDVGLLQAHVVDEAFGKGWTFGKRKGLAFGVRKGLGLEARSSGAHPRVLDRAR